ncbi:MAG TPA: S46 family peptidase [Salinivirgaceae bacterium]|nr:S46 family peptidase [Salinivirgaceae bacterium]HQA75864.1 S46 family peptidase [Salinivirgaceae bacterium]
MRKSVFYLFLVFLFTAIQVRADEGMWLPFKLKDGIINQMKENGLALEADDIYSLEKHGLSEAVVGLGTEGRPFRHFCTGGIISNQGLFITNHHCGYGFIQKHSTLQNDYLKDGFWAHSMEEELVNTGLTVSILRKMEDVTQSVFKGIDDKMSVTEIDSVIKENIKVIEKEAVEGNHYHAKVYSYYNDNEYYLSVYEIFNDVRLVGAPPSAIGNFGGDTDNWVWPRHTGDFALFRIYAGADNKPASYSPDNKPYVPDKYFEINGKGLSENDFTFVMGYPGITQQYLPSQAITLLKDHENPIRIELRDIRISIMKQFMAQDREVGIKYSSKVAGVANSWKRWIGEIQGLNRFDVVGQKKELENKFSNFAKSFPEYQNILERFDFIYTELYKIAPLRVYYDEGPYQIELLRFARQLRSLGSNADSIDKEKLISVTRKFYKDYHQPIDREICARILNKFDSSVPPEYQPDYFKTIKKEFVGNFDKIADSFYSQSIFADSTKLIELINDYELSKSEVVLKDPFYQLYTALQDTYSELIAPQLRQLERELPDLEKRYVEGLRKMQADRQFYPDANSSFRIAYGKTKGYESVDSGYYEWYTTLDGVIEKGNLGVYDYVVPDKLKDLYKSKDFGTYTGEDGKVSVCFAATNHTTGGNSGSPVVDAHGRLVGINFDRAWEGVMSDMYYNPEICRNISLDIRFALFIIERYGKAQNIIKELVMQNFKPTH